VENSLAADSPIDYRINPPSTNDELNALFATAWPDYAASDFAQILSRSLAYVCAYAGERLVGFVNLAWDGGVHVFLLDTTVHRDFQRRGIGRELVARAAQQARARGAEWLHVDYEPHLAKFYRECGFQHTEAGLIHLTTDDRPLTNDGRQKDE
jgi:GNAT superfamily N-acetyltransferase